MSTKDVFDHHVKCFGEGDLHRILADYSPSAIMFTPDGPLKGIDAIRPFGGVRIEDDVAVVAGGVRDFTREAFDSTASAA